MALIKLNGATKDYIWGGNKLFGYNKKSEKEIIAESWELSYHKDGLTVCDNGDFKGQYIKDILTNEDLGTNINKFDQFPILVKLIDANGNLSIQVHPNDEYALKNENSLGKSEAWYVVEAEKDATLFIGFKKDISKEELVERIQNNTLMEVLNEVKVKPGDCYFIEAGTIHAIGKGCLIAEVQESSNLTYRVYDYGRVDKNGNPRELHIEKAKEVLNLNKSIPQSLTGDPIIECKYFQIKKGCNLKEIVADSTSFVCAMILNGHGKIGNLPYQKGDSFFISANDCVKLDGNNEILLVRI